MTRRDEWRRSSKAAGGAYPTPPLHAAIDVGSHSVKLRIARRRPEGWETVLERVDVTALGVGDVARDGLAPAAVARTLDALRAYARTAADLGAADVAAAATAVLRVAAGAGDVVARVRDETGVALDIISGDEEARLTYLGAVASLPPAGGPRLVFDIGGKSTEVAWGRARTPDGRRSLDVGTISLAAAHGLDDTAGPRRLADARRDMDRALDTLPPVPAPAQLVGIGATPAGILSLDDGRDLADSMEIHGRPLPRHVTARWIDRLAATGAAGRRTLPGLNPDRGRVILAGAVITAALADRWPDAPLVISACGLRVGLLEDRFGPRD